MLITLVFKYDLDNTELTMENLDSLTAGDAEIGFSFVSKNDQSLIKYLRFGYEIYENEECITRKHFPIDGMKYHHVDNSPMNLMPFKIKPVTTYKILGWVDTPDGQRHSKTIQLSDLYPPKPFPSWIWNGEDWDAPVPRKFDKPYIWDETTQTWQEDLTTPPVMFAGYEVE
jgi:hypothetical protein